MFLTLVPNASALTAQQQQQQQQQIRLNLLNSQQNSVQAAIQQSQNNMQSTSNPSQVPSANQAITSQAQVCNVFFMNFKKSPSGLILLVYFWQIEDIFYKQNYRWFFFTFSTLPL